MQPVSPTFRHAAFVLAVACSGLASGAQTASSVTQALPAAVRDAGAVAAVNAAIAAMGGPAIVANLHDAKLQGTFAPASGTGNTGAFTWEYSFPAPPADPNATQPLAEFRVQVHRNGNNAPPDTVFASGHGSPGSGRIGANAAAVNKLSAASGQPYSVPVAMLARQLADRHISITLKSPTQIGSVTAVHVHLAFDAIPAMSQLTRQDWYFDPSTNLPMRVVYTLPAQQNPANVVEQTRNYSAWAAAGLLLLPYSMTVSWGTPSNLKPGVATSLPPPMVYTLTSADLNSGIPASEFDLPLTVAPSAGGGGQ